MKFPIRPLWTQLRFFLHLFLYGGWLVASHLVGILFHHFLFGMLKRRAGVLFIRVLFFQKFKKEMPPFFNLSSSSWLGSFSCCGSRGRTGRTLMRRDSLLAGWSGGRFCLFFFVQFLYLSFSFLLKSSSFIIIHTSSSLNLVAFDSDVVVDTEPSPSPTTGKRTTHSVRSN